MMRFLVFVSLVLISGRTVAQSDLELIAARNFAPAGEDAYYQRPGNDAEAVQLRHRSVLARYNPVSLALKGALLGYQRLVSQQLARSCPYQITCSNFSKQSIQQFGLVKGVFLSADRIMRCNRIGLLDVHPLNVHPSDGTIVDPPSFYR